MKIKTCLHLIAPLVAASLVFPPPASAADAEWIAPTTGGWNGAANWDPATAPGATSGTTNTDTAIFNDKSTEGTGTVTVDTYRNIQNIIINQSTGSNTASARAFNTGNLYLTSGGSITYNSEVGDAISTRVVFQVPVILGDSAGGTYSFTGNRVKGANLGGLTFNNNTGAFVAGAAGNGQTMTLKLNGNSPAIATNVGNSLRGVVSDGSQGGQLAVTKSGVGNWVVFSASTYTGETTVNEGTLMVYGSIANGSAVTVNSGGTLAGGNNGIGSAGVVAGPVSLNGGGRLQAGNLTAAGDGQVGTLTLGSLTTANGAFWDVDFSLTNNDHIAVTGELTLNGTMKVNLFHEGTEDPFFTEGTYTLLTANSIVGFTSNSFNVTNRASGYIYTFTSSGTAIELNIAVNPEPPAERRGPDSPLTLAPIFTDHAILQRDTPVPVWGTAPPRQPVSIAFAGQQHETVADADGHWRGLLDPLEGSSEGRELRIVCGEQMVNISDVLVGEVWLCSGQSNMQWPLRNSPQPELILAKANHPQIRQFRVQNVSLEEPAKTLEGNWVPCTPETAGEFTAVGYYFATDLQPKLGVPIGLINSSWGSTRIQAWMSSDALADFPQVAFYWERLLRTLPERQAQYEEERTAFLARSRAARERGEDFSERYPRPPAGPGTRQAPSGAFNGMIAPLAPYPIRGILWYQAEGNTSSATSYAEMFPRLIKDWRALWKDPALPFFFVQLPNYNLTSDSTGEKWAELREAQMAALDLPRTGAAITIDIGTPDDGHPPDKSGYGQRLARLAAHEVYGLEQGDSSGPLPKSVRLTERGVEITFAHATSGLEVRDGELAGFELAGAEEVYYSASALVQGDRVLVQSPSVEQPKSVRYAWKNNPPASLYNAVGLPASPFRMDIQSQPR
jgi:sialate O-acetylesterase